MKKTFFLPFCFILFAAFSPEKKETATLISPVKRTCLVNLWFTNNSTTYTIPSVSFSDSFTSDSGFNIAPTDGASLSIDYAGGDLEFNVQFTSPHPGGTVQLKRGKSLIATTTVAANQNIVTLQMDGAANVFCGGSYMLIYTP